MELFAFVGEIMAGQTLLEWIATQLLQRGTHAARPAATSVPEGTEYYETDIGARFKAVAGAWVDDGTSGSGGGGVVLQSLFASDNTYATLATTIPADNTIPTNTEGTQILTLAITASNAANRIHIHAEGCFGCGGGDYGTLALFKDSGGNALAAREANGPAGNQAVAITLDFEETAGDTSAHTYKLRFGGNGGSWFSNGVSGLQLYNGKWQTTLTISELTP